MDTKTHWRSLSAFILGVLLFVSGCSAPRHHDAIFFATNTLVGLRIGADAYQRPNISLAYDRQEGAVVPVYLANAEKYLSDLDPFVQGALESAKINLEKKTTEADKTAAALVTAAFEFYENDPKSTPSPTLSTIKKEIEALLIETVATKQAEKRALIIELINVEFDKSKLVLNFNRDAKYLATQTSDKKTDAYSVFGTFKGGSGARSDAEIKTTDSTATQGTGTSVAPKGTASASFQGNIAQSFATGVAAQIWAAQGAGIAGGTPNSISISSDFERSVDKGLANWGSKRDAIVKIVGIVFPGGTKDQAKEQKYRSILSPTNPNDTLYDQVFLNQDNLKNYLSMSSLTSDQLNEHLKQLEK